LNTRASSNSASGDRDWPNKIGHGASLIQAVFLSVLRLPGVLLLA
jgi:hypothetical protein